MSIAHEIWKKKKTFNRKINPLLFSLLLSDNPKDTTRVPVYVRILDVNDNAPQFAVFYDTFVCENARAGQVCL